ncbi:MAG: hypothetical protein R8N23_10635 [Reichenbachiella sp.]|uniref:hypothetical protein n=1 Tax=Reichenbachiella sp. TaxID=2184521 RepID=UPI0029675B3A|nr:hypothetical protein [Reichenbachiella sp.]MDW3210315.1 hypothetical protein [Reichenbachiella sp.]
MIKKRTLYLWGKRNGINRHTIRRSCIYLGSVLFALFLAIYREEILTGTKVFFATVFSDDLVFASLNVSWIALLYYLSTFIWVVFVSVHYGLINKSGEARVQSAIDEVENHVLSAVDDIKYAIYKTPNMEALSNAVPDFRTTIYLLKRLEALKSSDPSPESKERCESIFNEILHRGCQLLADFMRKDIEQFSANIMIGIENTKENEVLMEKVRKLNKNTPVPRHYIANRYIMCALISANKLHFPIGNGKVTNMVSMVLRDDIEELDQIPGPCLAYRKGEYIIPNTVAIEKEFQHLPDRVRKQTQKFYNDRSNNFLSLASFDLSFDEFKRSEEAKVTTRPRSVGVVNFFYEKENIISADSEFHAAFSAVIQPILVLLAEELWYYICTYKEEVVTEFFTD